MLVSGRVGRIGPQKERPPKDIVASHLGPSQKKIGELVFMTPFETSRNGLSCFDSTCWEIMNGRKIMFFF